MLIDWNFENVADSYLNVRAFPADMLQNRWISHNSEY